MSHVLSVAKFLDFSFISRFVYKLVSRLDERRVQRETYRQLSSMSFAPLSGLLNGLWSFGESTGRARAAAELSRMGMHEEAKRLMLGK